MAVLEIDPEKQVIKSREELIEECMEIGLPITGHEDEETLEMFLGSADDDDNLIDDDDFDDEFDDEIDEPVDDKEILDEEFDFDDDDDLDDEDPQYN